MSILLFSHVGAVAESIFIAIIFILLYIQNRENYLRNWMIAWILAFIGLCCFGGLALSQSFLTLYMICLSVSNWFLLRAAYQFFGIVMPRLWKNLTLITVVWLITCVLLGLSDLFSAIPWSIFVGIAVMYNGFMFLRYGDRNISVRIVVGCSYILWGIHAMDFSYLYMHPWFAPVGFLIGNILALGGAVGTLYYYFEKKNRELLRIEQELKYLSFHDALTGLFNRNYFEQEIKRRENEKRTEKTNCLPTGIIICDVDGLKLVNDTLGHERGDLLLIETARIIQSVFPKRGLVARIGGDEFAILLEDNEEGLKHAYQDIYQALCLYNANHPELPLSISVGYAVDRFPPDLDQTFREADSNMYKEKLRQSQRGRASIVEALMLALDKKDFAHSSIDHL
ncbi:MAG: GGDEF domain-containing protein [Firmicutes bacterium]|nr:GGDEF domain-containing protein [Bacillota bacterium]